MAITITTPPQNNITVNETTQSVNVTNTTNTISVQTSGISATPAATTFSALTDVAVTTPYGYGHLISVDNQLKLVSRATVATNVADNRPVFQYSASNAGSNSSIVLKKHYGATNFANGDGSGIRFEVDSDAQPATEFAILHAQYGTTNPAFVFATSINDGTSYQNNLVVREDKTTVYGDLQVVGNTIQSSTAAPAIELTGADVKTYGNLTIGGNNIKTANGTTAMTLTDVSGNVSFLGNVLYGGDLTVSGNTIAGSGGNAIELSGSNVATLGNLSIGSNIIKTANNTTAMTLENTTGNVTFAGDIKLMGDSVYSSTGWRMFDYRETTSVIYGTSYQVKMNADKNIGVVASFYIIDDIIQQNSSSLTTTATTTAILDYFDKTMFRSAKYIIQISNGSDHQMWEGMMIQDGTTIKITAYGDLRSNDVNLASISAGFNATTGYAELRVTPVFATQTKFKAMKTYINV
jgi:hypothetical protein